MEKNVFFVVGVAVVTAFTVVSTVTLAISNMFLAWHVLTDAH